MKEINFYNKKNNFDPKIYGYTDEAFPDMIKIGYTERDNVEKRIKEQYPIKRPRKTWKIVFVESAIRDDGSTISDTQVRDTLENNGFPKVEGEWVKCNVKNIKQALIALKNNEVQIDNRVNTFKLRPDQNEAIEKTSNYFLNYNKLKLDGQPSFLWNAKMRFGKTFTAYKLAEKMKWKKILILTYKPAVENSWKEDLISHVDFKGWKFLSKNYNKDFKLEKNYPTICFGSFQDYLGKNSLGGIKATNEFVHETHWDCIIFDEYHYGAWTDNAKVLTNLKDLSNSDAELKFQISKKEIKDTGESTEELKFNIGEDLSIFNKDTIPVTSNHYLYLSGTPFRALSSGEFTEEQIFNWTYTQEQNSKYNWNQKSENPYKEMPRMFLMTYEVPKYISNVALKGEFNEFDLNVFFKTNGKSGDEARFLFEDYVQKWLDLIRGSTSPTSIDYKNSGSYVPPILPFHQTEMLESLLHTLWFLPTVSSCEAMKNLLSRSNNIFYHDYKIIVAAGNRAGIGLKALPPLRKAMGNPLKTKTITLTCQKLTTGVTVKPWSGILMLRNTTSPEQYFQSAFRVQSPWTIDVLNKNSKYEKKIIKDTCYIFDFSPMRALRLISDYSARLYKDEDKNIAEKVQDFIKFLPVLSFDGSQMRKQSVRDILDVVETGTSGNLLAKKWQDFSLINVDNHTLEKVLADEKAIKAIMSIEGFRKLNTDISSIISISNQIKKIKNKGNTSDKQTLTELEKEYKSKRKEIREKLLKFATRIPIFMYITDFREEKLTHVIQNLESELFQKVTGLTINEFELLLSTNLFNQSLMNDAVFKFKLYEDSSLNYTGISKHKIETYGLFNTVVKKD